MSYHATHAHGIGCGELAAILGLDPRRSALDVWAVKRKLVTPKDEDDPTMERGRVLESSVVDYLETRIGVKLMRQRVNGVGDYDVPITRGRLIGSPDAGLLAADRWDCGAEAKTRNYLAGWGADGSDEIPPAERAQVEGYIAITDAPRWYVPVLFGMPFEFRVYVIERDPARCAKILAFVDSWWQRHVVEGIAPEAVAPEDHSRRARLMHPKAGREIIRSSHPAVVELMERRHEVEIEREQWKQLGEDVERRWRELGGRIEELIGDAAGIETPVGSAHLNSRTSRGRLVTKWHGE